MKFCKHCNQSKPLEEFGKSSKEKDGKYRLCRSCNSEKCKEWNKKNMISLDYAGNIGWRKEIKIN